MGKYSVPEEIRAMKPRGTMVKAISGRYYVYEYKSVTRDGKRKTEMGRCIGSITADLGFVPNSTRAREGELTTVEFGQYAVALEASEGVLSLLAEHFNPMDAAQLYCCALVMAVNGAVAMKDVGRLASMSLLALRFPSVPLSPESLSGMLDALGRRQGPVEALEARLCAECGPEVAVDGHALPSGSALSDLAEPGYRKGRLGSDQVNVLMAYDIASGRPVLARAYEGAALDKSCVRELLSRADLSGRLFVVDAGFYGEENLAALSSDGSDYVIPLHRGLKACKEAVAAAEDGEPDGRFVYRRSGKGSVVEWRESPGPGGSRVIWCCDRNRQALEQAGYLAKLEQGAKGYTQAGFDAAKDVMGVIVLRTSSASMTAQEVYEAYKRRWSVETFYDWLKNGAGFTSLGQQDYCRAQGMAFLMLVTALVRRSLEEACSQVKGKSVDDCLLEARMVKANRVRGEWTCCNLLKRQEELFAALGTPLSVEPFLPKPLS